MANPIHGETHREKPAAGLRRTSEQITTKNEQQEKRAHFYQNRAQNLTFSYLLCQLILFASLTSSSSSSIRCNQWWVPFSLSGILAILYFAALWSALASYHRIATLVDTYRIEQQRIRGLIYDAEEGNGVVLDIDPEHVMKLDGFVVFKRLVCVWSFGLVLVGFTAVVLLSSRVLLCRR